jgi:hypothetical protein
MPLTLSEYFARPDTPAAKSPVGTVMVKVLEKYPGVTFEEARVKANALIQESARRKRFVMPKVLSETELAEQSARLKTAWKTSKSANADVSSTNVAPIPS